MKCNFIETTLYFSLMLILFLTSLGVNDVAYSQLCSSGSIIMGSLTLKKLSTQGIDERELNQN